MDNGKVDMGSKDIVNIDSSTSDMSVNIKIQSEVEKILMNYDLDNNGFLDLAETSLYLKARCPHIPE